MIDLLLKSSYYYNLPKKLIAQYPLKDRHNSRLMVIDRKQQNIQHKHFYDIIDYLVPGDVLVLNKTRVIPARLFGKKENGTTIEVFLLNEIGTNVWNCLVHPGKRIKKPQLIKIADDLSGFISESDKEGIRTIEFSYTGDFWTLLDKYGHIPLPPYIERADEKEDANSYQTVYAEDRGSVAAPTAGFHFTEDLLNKLDKIGVIPAEVILHVGLGTFRPVKADTITEHKMHSEFCILPEQTADKINQAKFEKRRIIAVGTTTVRTLESFGANGLVRPGRMWTDIFIYPGKDMQIIDVLITNFHLPESTLIMLVAAFAGYDLTMRAYENAVENNYRFFSYGDAMLII